MSANDTEVKLGQLDMKMQSIEAIVARIENSIERFVSIDRNVAELVIQHQHTQEKIADIKDMTLMCNESHKLATEAMHQRVSGVSDRVTVVSDKINELESKSSGALKVLVWVCGGLSTVIFAGAAFLIDRTLETQRTNTVQQGHIDQVEKDLAVLRERDRAQREAK